MPAQQESRFDVSSADLLRYDWNQRLIAQPKKDCSLYFGVFVEAAKEAEAAGDSLAPRVYALLHVVASFHPNFEARGNPFGPMMSGFDGRRSLMAEDLVEADLDALTGIYEHIEDAEFRARVADVVWESRRDYKAAQAAVAAYVKTAEFHKTDDLWPDYEERLRRAAQISAKIGYKKALHVETITLVEEAIDFFNRNLKSGLLCVSLIRILLAHNLTKPGRHGIISERLAAEFAKNGDLRFSHHYWQVAEEVYRDAKSTSDVSRCELAGAEALVSIAEEGIGDNKYGFGHVAHWLAKALQALRQARANPARIKEVHQKLLGAQKRAVGEMVPLELNIEAMPGFRESEQEAQDKSAKHVKGYAFDEALARLVHVSRPTDVTALGTQLAKQSQEFIWDKIAGTNALDHQGKVVDYIPPAGGGTPAEEAEGKRKRMVQMAREVNWNLKVTWQIEPARKQMLLEHSIRWEQLAPLLRNNPLVPPGHAGIFIRGFQSGFFGDWLVAMHLLIPQVEAVIRYGLQQNGVVTSTLEQDGTQKEKDLNQLLWLPETEDLLGPDLLFDLRGILIERFGYNMRNESAHGLMSEAEFYQPAASFLWWLLLRLCWLGFRLAASIEKPEE